MPFNRHAYLGRDDDRTNKDLRTHEPRAGFAPTKGGLNPDPSFYTQRPKGSEGYFPTGLADEGAIHSSQLEDNTAHSSYDAVSQGAVMPAPRNVGPRREYTSKEARKTSYVDRFTAPPMRRGNAQIADEIDAILAGNDLDVDVSAVHGWVEDGEVTLEGVVDDPEQKWRIEELCYAIDGVHDVVNNIRISRRAGGEPPPRADWR
jgi:hypothetical protein